MKKIRRSFQGLEADEAILKLGRIFGFIPFFVDENGRVKFRWLSWHTVYYLWVVFIYHVMLMFRVYMFVSEMARNGPRSAMTLSGFIFGSLVMCSIHWCVLSKKTEIVDNLNKYAREVSKMSGELGDQLRKQRRLFFYIWLLFSGLFPTASVMLHNFYHPESKSYISYYISDDSNRYKTSIVLFSMAFHCVIMIHLFFSSLISDLLPLMFACGFNGAFERINQNLQNMSPGAKSVEWTMNKTTSDMSNLFCITGSENDSGKAKRINSSLMRMKMTAIRANLEHHYAFQRCLYAFNASFSPFLILFVVQIFLMCIGLFFTLLKMNSMSSMNCVIYLGNGMQYLVRGTCVLHAFGKVAERASDAKRILTTEVYIQEYPDLRQEANLFIAQLQEVCISAGSYIYFSKGFLLSFYGVLVTYMAIIIQSL